MIKIRTKLVLTFLAISAFVGVMAIGVYFTSRNVADSFDEISNYSVPRINALQQMKIDSLVIYSRAVEFTMEDDQDELPEYLEEISHAKEDFVEACSTYSSALTDEGMEQAIMNDWDEFASDADELVRLVQNGAADDEIDEMREELERALEKFESTVDHTLVVELAHNQTLKASGDNSQSSLFVVILVVFAASVAFAAGLGSLASYRITKPLVELKNSVMELAKGNYEAKIVKTSNDEIGDLAVHFENMKDELKEKDKMQNEFIMVASHELRTPIQPILGFTQLALKGQMEMQDAMKRIRQEAKRLKYLADDILDVTRIEGGKMIYNMEDINIKKMMEEMVQRFKPLIPAGMSIVANMSATNEFVRGDRKRLRQAFSNVLNNAIKFTQIGTITVSCAELKDSGKLEIIVSDEGTGIPPEILPQLFAKFVTKDVDGRNKHGTGLGLFITKAIIEDHGGQISAYNDGKGAVFTIVLPSTKQEMEQHIKRTSPL